MSQKPLTRQDLDARKCEHGCEDHDLMISLPCHPSVGYFVSYNKQTGVIRVHCPEVQEAGAADRRLARGAPVMNAIRRLFCRIGVHWPDPSTNPKWSIAYYCPVCNGVIDGELKKRSRR